MLAERAGLSMESAFEAMRTHARNHNLLLVNVARRVIDRTPGPRSPRCSPSPVLTFAACLLATRVGGRDEAGLAWP